jgi:hypothetical protein
MRNYDTDETIAIPENDEAMAVDMYFQEQHYSWSPDWPYEQADFSIQALHHDEFEDIYGLSEENKNHRPVKVVLPYGTNHALITNTKTLTDRAQKRGELVILSECPHDGKKHRHHPDYDKPSEVMLLCRKCHSAEHSRIYLEQKEILFTALVSKIHFSHKSLPPIQTSTGGTRRSGAGVGSVRKSKDESMGGFSVLTLIDSRRQDEPTAKKSEVVTIQLGFNF